MRPHKLAGEINRANAVHVYVDFATGENGFYWLEVSKARAKEIVDDAREKGIDDIAAHVKRGGVYIGDPADFDDEPEEPEDPAEVASDWRRDT